MLSVTLRRAAIFSIPRLPSVSSYVLRSSKAPFQTAPLSVPARSIWTTPLVRQEDLDHAQPQAAEHVKNDSSMPLSDSLYVGNLPWATTEDELREQFGKFGDIIEARIGVRPDGMKLGFAHVQFASEAIASQVLEHFSETPLMIDGRTIRLGLSVNKDVGRTQSGEFSRREKQPNPETNKLYVGNLPYDTTDQELKEKFSLFGEVLEVRRGSRTDGLAATYTHVEFSSLASAQEVMRTAAAEPLRLGDRVLRIEYASDQSNREGRQPAKPGKKVYIHLWTGSDAELADRFPPNIKKQITEIYHLKNKDSGLPDGRIFISFENIPVAQEAIDVLKSDPALARGIRFAYDAAQKQNDGRDWKDRGRGRRSSAGGRDRNDGGYNERRGYSDYGKSTFGLQ